MSVRQEHTSEEWFLLFLYPGCEKLFFQSLLQIDYSQNLYKRLMKWYAEDVMNKNEYHRGLTLKLL